MRTKLRGAFDPRMQIAFGALMVLICATLAFPLTKWQSEEAWARLDLRLLPLGFILGMLVGVPIGNWRLQALRKAVPEVEGRFFLSQRSVLSRFREGENAIKLQQRGFAFAFLALFGLSTFTHGRIILFGSFASYIAGQYLIGQTLPFLRLWLDLKKKEAV